MAGKKWKKILAAGLCGLMAAGLIAGCGGSDGGKSDAKMKVGVVQIVQHPALDESNKGFVDALNEQGLKDKVDIDQQNAQGDQSNLRSIACVLAKWARITYDSACLNPRTSCVRLCAGWLLC